MKNYTRIIIMACYILCSLPLSAQWKWAVGSDCPKSVIESWPIALDDLGNVYETGHVFSTEVLAGSIKCYFGTDTLVGQESVLVSTDSTGHYRWAIGTTNGEIFGVASAQNNSIYVYGAFRNIMTFGGHIIAGSSSFNGFCAKVSSYGTVLWLEKICDFSIIEEAKMDGAGNVYVAGNFSGTSATIGSSTISNASYVGNSDALIAKLDSSGTAIWAKCFGGDSNEDITAISVNAMGESYIGGSYNSGLFSIGGITFTFPSAGAWPYSFAAKIDATGVVKWAKQISSRGANYLRANTIDKQENVYYAGGYTHNIIFGTDSFSYTPAYQMYLTSYDSAGNFRWARTVEDRYSQAQSVSADLCGNVWVSGTMVTLPFSGATDPMYIFKFDTSGNIVDTLFLPTGGDDQSALVVDNKGGLYVGGDYWPGFHTDTFYIGPDTLLLVDSTQETLFIAKYSYPICSIPATLETTQINTTETAVMLYPNPATDECTITIPKGAATLTKTDLYDMTGRLIHSYPLSGNRTIISTTELKPGIYSCIIYTTGSNKYTHKLAVIK